jgi:DNA-binding transcriptional LysR family regulator
VDLNVVQGFLAIAELGSMSKAALRLHVSQSTLTRQVRALESELGTVLFDRSGAGVTLTAAGRAFRDGIRPALEQVGRVVTETRRVGSGKQAALRIGYIASAAQKYLSPALRTLRNESAGLQVRLLDQTPSEQIAALRKGQLDLALIGFSPTLPQNEFFLRKLVTVPAVAVLPDNHPLAQSSRASLRDLSKETFIAIPEADAPGYNAWVRAVCRKAGFRPRFTEPADSMAHLLAMIAAENLAAIVPKYAIENAVPGLAVLPLKESYATADLVVAWPRGKLTEPMRRILKALFSDSTRAPASG